MFKYMFFFKSSLLEKLSISRKIYVYAKLHDSPLLSIDCKAASDNRWSIFTGTYSEYTVLPHLSICNYVIIA